MVNVAGFFSNSICCHPPEKTKGETACLGHCFNDFIGVLLMLSLIEGTSIETCIGRNCKLGFFFCSKSLVNCSNFKVIIRGGVDEIRLEAKDTKKFYAKDTLFRPKPDLLEAKDTGSSVLQKQVIKIIFR